MTRDTHSPRDEVEYYVRLQPGLRPGKPLRATLLSLSAVSMAAWVLTFHYARAMSALMGIAVGDIGAPGTEIAEMMTAWSLAGASVFVMMWAVMMAAMMLPSAAPMIAIFATKQARSGHATLVPTSIFVAAYLFVWSAVGLLVYLLVQAGSDISAALAPAERVSWAPLLVGATLLIAGLFQFTPFKRTYLRHCRSPFGFVLRQWQPGNWGAVRMGLQHGAYCVGCCWALFAVLVAAGVMSVGWMLLLTLLIFIEKVLPQSRFSAATIGVLFVALGLVVGSGAAPLPLAG